jgi:hypothetical protein
MLSPNSGLAQYNAMRRVSSATAMPIRPMCLPWSKRKKSKLDYAPGGPYEAMPTHADLFRYVLHDNDPEENLITLGVEDAV